MHWKKKVSDHDIAYERLVEGLMDQARSAAKGYVPVLVGRSEGDSEMQRIVVPVRIFKKPCMKRLLDETAMEFGYGQEGVLRIPCDVEYFRQVINVASKDR